MENGLRNLAKLLGFLLLGISIYLSYDGFDQGVTGGNMGYSNLAKLIGAVLAVTISAIQFIFSSRYDQLNVTLKMVGVTTYAYSIWTNYLGAKHLLQMDEMTSLVTALFVDIVAEPMISWGLGDSMKGDLFGNLGKWFTGYQPKIQQPQQYQHSEPRPQNHQSRQEHGNRPKHKQGRDERIEQLQRMYHGPDRRQDTQPRQQMGFNKVRDLNKQPLTDEELDEKIKKLGYKYDA